MSDNFIILSYPRYAGGKFIGNCLSLSKECSPQDKKSARYLLTKTDDYQYRLNAVMSTLPATREEMINWIPKYEFGDNQFYGTHIFGSWVTGNYIAPDRIIEQLLDKKLRLFLTAHGGDGVVRRLLKVWPNSTIIKLINHTKFSKISQNLKSTDTDSIDMHAGNYCKSKYDVLSGPSWPSWQEFESVGYNIQKLSQYKSVAEEILNFYNWKDINNKTFLFDIDSTIFNRNKFLEAMEQLYTQLNLTDFNPILIEKFWQSYIALHVDNVDLL